MYSKDLDELIEKNKAYVVHCKKSRYDVYVGRPSLFGNPFEIGKDGTREEVVQKYKEWILQDEEIKYVVQGITLSNFIVMKAVPKLKGRILGCWCAPKLCHAHILAELANA